MFNQIKLFQTDRIWAAIGPEIIDLVNSSHALGPAQNGDITLLLEQIDAIVLPLPTAQMH